MYAYYILEHCGRLANEAEVVAFHPQLTQLSLLERRLREYISGKYASDLQLSNLSGNVSKLDPNKSMLSLNAITNTQDYVEVQ
jgi:hypothetical protein